MISRDFFLQIGSETEIGDYLQQVVMMTIWTMMMPWCLLWKNIGNITFHFHEKTNHTNLIFNFTNFFRPSAYDIGRPKEDDDINNIRDYYTNMMTRQRAINRYGMLISREKNYLKNFWLFWFHGFYFFAYCFDFTTFFLQVVHL